MIKIIKLPTVIFLTGMILISGCAGTSTKKAEIKPEVIPDGMALIYIYVLGGFGYYYDVTVGNKKAFPLRAGHCYRYFAKPGELEVWAETETKSSVTLDVKSGETYFIRAASEFGLWKARPHLELVPKETVKPWQVEDCPEV